jgi:hypothetical protein
MPYELARRSSTLELKRDAMSQQLASFDHEHAIAVLVPRALPEEAPRFRQSQHRHESYAVVVVEPHAFDAARFVAPEQAG